MTVRVLVVVGASLAVTWAVLMSLLFVLRPRGIDARDVKRFVPDVARLLARLARDRSLGWGVRVRLLVLLAYLASPIDLVPDFVPLLGYADDVIVAAIALRSVIRHAGPDAFREHWPGSPSGLDMVHRMAGLDIDRQL